MKQACEHLHFHTSCQIARLTETEGGPVKSWSASIAIRCTDCGLNFKFIGLTPGFSFREPSCGVGGVEARMPIEPSEEYTT